MNKVNFPAFRTLLAKYKGKRVVITCAGRYVVLKQVVSPNTYQHLETLYEADTLSEAHSYQSIFNTWLKSISKSSTKS